MINMNKIVLKNDDLVDNLVIQEDTDLVLTLEYISNNINIIIDENVYVNVVELSMDTQNTISFRLNENSRLIYNRLVKNSNDSIYVDLDGINSSVEINNSILSNKRSVCNFNINHNNVSTLSKLSNHGINDSKENLVFNVNAKIVNSAKDSITKQENKIINTNCGKSNIYPNLIVDIDEVDASHSAYISDFDYESLFYMKSRGIKEINARKILLDAFLLGNLENFDEYMSEAKKKLNKWR